jgi:hypothetical protein
VEVVLGAVATTKVAMAVKVVGQVVNLSPMEGVRLGPNLLWTTARRSATTAAKPATGRGIVTARGRKNRHTWWRMMSQVYSWSCRWSHWCL